jgi:hypothetical protein
MLLIIVYNKCYATVADFGLSLAQTLQDLVLAFCATNMQTGTEFSIYLQQAHYM